ncbi:MAG: YezD family protein [Candidatus Omnitrophota bacterium]
MATEPEKVKKGNIINDAIIKDIAVILGGLKYGEIVIKVHDSKIIQVEKTEKTRYDNYRGMEQGCGI